MGCVSTCAQTGSRKASKIIEPFMERSHRRSSGGSSAWLRSVIGSMSIGRSSVRSSSTRRRSGLGTDRCGPGSRWSPYIVHPRRPPLEEPEHDRGRALPSRAWWRSIGSTSSNRTRAVVSGGVRVSRTGAQAAHGLREEPYIEGKPIPEGPHRRVRRPWPCTKKFVPRELMQWC